MGAFTTREEWLRTAVTKLEVHLVEKTGYRMPEKWAVTCGWPLGSRKAIGQCFDPKTSRAGVTEMFISPELDDPVRVLDVLLHEMVHAAVGCEHKHGRVFARAARACGLEGPLTATTAGDALREVLERIAADLGEYPHSAVDKLFGPKKNKGGQWPTYISPVDPTYRVQVRTSALEEHGPPICPISGDMMVPSQGRNR
jgi:SprT-like family.